MAKNKAGSCKPDNSSIAELAKVLERAEAEIAELKEVCREDYNSLMDEVCSPRDLS